MLYLEIAIRFTFDIASCCPPLAFNSALLLNIHKITFELSQLSRAPLPKCQPTAGTSTRIHAPAPVPHFPLIYFSAHLTSPHSISRSHYSPIGGSHSLASSRQIMTSPLSALPRNNHFPVLHLSTIKLSGYTTLRACIWSAYIHDARQSNSRLQRIVGSFAALECLVDLILRNSSGQYEPKLGMSGKEKFGSAHQLLRG